MSTIIIITPPPKNPTLVEQEQSERQLIADAKALEDAGFDVRVIEPKK